MYRDLNASQTNGTSDCFTRTLLDTVADGVITIDAHGLVRTFNGAAERLFGYAAAEVIGHNVSMLMPSPHREMHDNYLSRYRDGGERKVVGIGREVIGLRKGGTTFPMHLSIGEARAQGEWFFVGVVHDLSERVAAEQALRASEEHFRMLVDSAPLMMWLTDADAQCVYFSGGWYAFTGRRAARELGHGWMDGVHPDDLARCRGTWLRAFHSRQPLHSEFRLRHADGEYRWVLNEGRPRIDGEGRFLGYVGACVDISKRAGIEEALRRSEDRYRTVVDGLKEVVFQTDAEGNWTFLNPAWTEITGHPVGDCLGTPFFDHFHPEDGEDNRARLKSLVERRKEHCRHEVRLLTGNGEIRRVQVYMRLTLAKDGAVLGTAGTLTDVTERHKAEEHLRLAAKVYEHTSEGILVTDAKRIIVSVNGSFTAITGYSAEEARGHTFTALCIAEGEREKVEAEWDALAHTSHWQGEVQCRRRDAGLRTLGIRMSAVKETSGEISNYVAIINDITDFKQNLEQLEYLAKYDSLTQLPNRHMFLARTSQAIEVVRRQEGGPIALLLVDLDNFKDVNDAAGHDAGDELLKEIASRMRRCVRRHDDLGRLGGDEFTVLLADIKDAREAANTAQRILRALSAPVAVRGQEVFVSGSVGISVYPDDGADAMTLLRSADAAMYLAKRLGKNQYHYFEEELNQQSRERLALETRLRRAIENGEFALHYQPQVDVTSGRLVGVEALLRWTHPEDGAIPPDRFIPVAEQTGLIVPIDQWVLEQACAQINQWRVRSPADLRVAVNLSARHLRNRDLSRFVEASISRSGIPPSCLEVEITESCVMEDVEQAVRILNELAEIGVQIAIDDFGTGYSSLGYIKRFPIERIKIDRMFISDVTTNRDDAAIVKAVIALARGLELQTVAEGVETAEQLAFLREQGCDEAQGYYFSRPLPAAEIGPYRRRLAERG